MNNKTVKIVAIPILGIVFAYVLYQQYGGPAQQPTELAVQLPQKVTPAANAKEVKEGDDTPIAQSVKSFGAFNPFARSRQIESLYQQPTSPPVAATELEEHVGDRLVSKTETYLKLPAESLQATFEGTDGWVAMIDSKTYSIGDAIVDENGEQYGVIVQISAGNVLISQDERAVQ